MNRATPLTLALLLFAAPPAFAQEEEKKAAAPAESPFAADLKKLDRSIELSKDLILRRPDAPELPELMLRLAELYVEKSRLIFEMEMRAQEDADRTLSGERSMEVQLAKRLAVETFEKLVTDYPDWAHADQARFFKAHELRELGLWNLMVEELQALVKAHPASRWAVEANLILGDYYFDRSSVLEAEPYYRKILERPESHLHDMARYKLGWVRINQERFKDALELFEGAVSSRRKESAGAVGAARVLNVKRESLMALTWPFSEVRKSSEAITYFRNLSPSKTAYVDALRRLANRYYIKTRYAEAVSLYREVVNRSQQLDRNIDYLQRLYEGVVKLAETDQRGAFAEVDRDLAAFAETTARYRNDWSRDAKDKAALEKDLEIRARDLVTKAHAAAQTAKDPALFAASARAYDHYLSVFDAGDIRNEMRQNRADALAEAEKSVDAGRRYEELASGLAEEDEARKDAVYRGVAAYYAAIEADTQARLKRAANKAGPVQGALGHLDRLWARRGLLALGRWYVERYPEDAKAPEVKFNIARMVYQEGDYERASALFATFVETHPAHPAVPSAGNLALDALHKLDRFEALAELADKFAKNAAITDSAFRTEAGRLAAAARKREVEFTVLETPAESFDETMLAEWEAKKDTAMGEEILFTAYQRYVSQKEIRGVREFGERYLEAYPKAERALPVAKTRIAFASSSGDFDRASAALEQAIGLFPEAKEIGSWKRTVADLHRVLGLAASAKERYAALAAAGDEDARSALMELQYGARDWPALQASAAAAAKARPKALAPRYYLSKALAEQGNSKEAAKALKRALRLPANDGYDEAIAGEVPLAFAASLHAQYEAVVFNGPRRAERVMQSKVDLLGAAEGAYVKAIESGYGDAAIAALHGIAKLYATFGVFLEGAPVPRGTAGAAAEEYRAALRAQAVPYRQKADETLAVCAAKAAELRVFSPHAQACVASSYDVPGAPAAPARRRIDPESLGAEVQTIRRNLATQSDQPELLVKMAEAVLGAGDAWLAGVLLSRSLDLDPASTTALNLAGVAAWMRGDAQAAHSFFEPAAEKGDVAAQANLVGLYAKAGFDALAQETAQALGQDAQLPGAPAVHPEARSALSALGGGS